MNDQEVREKLIDLVYGELDQAQAEALMEKVRRSPELAEELGRLRRARAAMAVHRAGEPRQPVRLPVGRGIRFRRFLGTAAAVAAAIIIAVGAWMFFEGTKGVAVAGPVEIKRLNVSLTVLSEPEEWPRYYYPNAQPMPYQQVESQVQRQYRSGLRRGWPGLALVRDQRLIANLRKGQTEVRFRDVPSGILPDTVRLRSLDRPGGLTILEQNYQYDLASAAAILRKYVDKPIAVLFKDGARAAGELLSSDQAALVVRPADEGPRNISREMVKDIQFAKLPEGLLTTPTLVWLLENKAAARQQFEVAYMTHGLKWRADYVLKLHPAKAAPKAAEGRNPEVTDTADLVGYATVTNDSGVSYEQAQLKLMAGDVHLIRPEEAMLLEQGLELSRRGRRRGEPQFKEKAFFEYHLYTLVRPTTLRSAETKQIELVTGGGIRMLRKYVYDRRVHATAARVVSEFKNSEANGLGKPLPKGVVRLYAPDPEGLHTYVSKTNIDHTPRDETIRLGWGYAFDIACTAKRDDYRRRGRWDHYEKWQYSLRNHKEHDVTITVVIHVPAVTYSFDCDRPWKLPKVGWIEMEVPVKANTAEVVTFSYRYNYRSGGGLKAPPQE